MIRALIALHLTLAAINLAVAYQLAAMLDEGSGKQARFRIWKEAQQAKQGTSVQRGS